MSSITELKERVNTKTWNLVLLAVATAGLYPLLWLWQNHTIIDQVTQRQTANTTYLIWLAVCIGWGGALGNTGDNVLILIGSLLSLAGAVLYIVWAFRARAALQEYALNEHKIDLRMNGFYTFIFNVYYINYCINDLPEALRKQQILQGKTQTTTV